MRSIPKPAPSESAGWTPLAALTPAMILVLAACGSPTPTASSSVPTTIMRTSTTAAVTPTPTTTPGTTTTADTTGTAAAVAPSLQVPSGSPPTIDGVLDTGEWEEATVESMSDGATLRLMQNDETLYVSVQSDEIGAVNLVITTEDEVSILHSSAALGSALYIRSGSNWELSHGFTWCCRSTSDETGREALLEAERWVANIGFAGEPGVVEYAVALPWHGAALAVSSIRDDDDKGFWPARLSVDARDQLLGEPPAKRTFSIEEWARIIPAD